MERRAMVVCGLVGFLGLVSAALAFAGEATKVKASDVQTTDTDQCIYPKTPALALGLFSIMALLLAHATINAVAGCICCKRRPYPSDTNWKIGLISFIISWATFILAFLLLLSGAAQNDQRQEQGIYYFGYCYVGKPGVFAGGAVLALASVALGIVYYVAFASPKGIQPVGPQQNEGIVMGQPQIPPQSTEPVFVHEDTYNRRQFA